MEIDKTKIKTHRNYIILIVALVFFLFIRECSNQNYQNDLVKDISTYKTKSKTFENKFKQQVSYNDVLKFQNEKQLKSYLSDNDTIKDMLKKFKVLASVVTNNQVINIRSDSFPYEVPIPCNFKPFSVIRDSSHYFFKGTISQNAFVLDSLRIPNKQTIVVGNKKKGLFNYDYQVEVLNSNPLIQTPNIGAYTINQKKKWYQRPVVTFGIGFASGFVMNSFIKK